MPAAKPMTKIIRTRAKANERSLPSPNRTRAIMFWTSVRIDGLFDRSARPLEISDTAEVRLGFIASLHLPATRSEEHTSELQSLTNLVCRLLLEKKKTPQSIDKLANEISKMEAQCRVVPR